MPITVDVEDRRVLADLAGQPASIAKAAVATMRRITTQLLAYLVQNKLSNAAGAGNQLHRRTATLARSAFQRVEVGAGVDLVGRVGFDLAKARYARAVTMGATITPKQASYLTIPVGEALTRSGVARFGAREFIEQTRAAGSHGGGGEWHGFTGSFVNKNRTAIMGIRPGGAVEPVFLLRKSVTLPVRDVLGETVRENATRIQDWWNEGLAARTGSGYPGSATPGL